MPNAQQKPKDFNARRFAALLAGFDVGNPSEEEAVSKARALRRMAANANMRVVDLMELPDVKRAIDDQLQPVRTETPGLRQALEQVAALQEELTERTRDVREMAESLRQREETIEAMRRQSAAAPSAPVQGRANATPSSRMPGVPSWGFQAGAALLAAVLLIVAFFAGNFQERSNGNGLGNGKGASAAVVRKGRAVRPVPGTRALHRRVRPGGSGNRTR